MNPYASVKHAYAEASVLTAPPERLVVMLYDGAIRFLTQSAAAMRAEQFELARTRMQRAEAIIDELNMSLDMSHGEVPERLRAIYTFCKRYLIEATIERDPARIDTVRSLLTELRSAWDTVATEVPVAATA